MTADTNLFWTAIGASVPIIALANQAIITDGIELLHKYTDVPFSLKPIRQDSARAGRYCLWAALSGAIVNMFIQIFLFASLLVGFYGGAAPISQNVEVTSNSVSPGGALNYQIFGLLLLLATATMLGIAKNVAPEEGVLKMSEEDVKRLAKAMLAELRELQHDPEPRGTSKPPQSDTTSDVPPE